jgi:hypothetical protein
MPPTESSALGPSTVPARESTGIMDPMKSQERRAGAAYEEAVTIVTGLLCSCLPPPVAPWYL